MDENLEYRFRIDVFTPGTLPMARLAQYLEQLAHLFGHNKEIHFKGVEKGSAVLVPVIDQPAITDVRMRVATIGTANASKEVAQAYKALNDLLRKDDAIGELYETGSQKIIKFPGRETPKPETFGPIEEAGTIEGTLTKIGGRDATVPVEIREYDGHYQPCTTSVENAQLLAAHLFKNVRVDGLGKWYRNEDGHWELRSFTITNFEAKPEVTLAETIRQLRAVEGSEWNQMEDPLAELRRIREND